MNEDSIYPDQNKTASEEEVKKVSLDKPHQSIYEEGTTPRQGEYRETLERAPGAYRQEGHSENMYQQMNQNVNQASNQGFGIASMVLGILSLVLFCACINIPLAIVAIVLGIFQLCGPGGKKGMAITGIITSVISMILFAASVLIFISSIDLQDEFQRSFENRTGESFFEEYRFPDHHIDDSDTF